MTKKMWECFTTDEEIKYQKITHKYMDMWEHYIDNENIKIKKLIPSTKKLIQIELV